MKKILVPTDFSENAQKALQFAVAISNRFETDILLYHVYRVGTSAAEKFKTTLNDIIKEDKEKELQKAIKKIKPTLKKGSIEGKAANGDVGNLVVDKADKEHFDLIVMGSKGETGLEGILYGSTAVEIIRRSETPVVVIPEKAVPKPVKRIVLAVDGRGISDPELLNPIIELVHLRDAKVKIFHKAVSGERKELHPSIAEALEGIDYTYHCVETDTDDISDSIRDFVVENEADMLCVIRRKKGWIQRLFKENVSRDSAHDRPIPLLVIKD